MKPVYVVLLMGAAAVVGGLFVRYTDHPARIPQSNPAPPTVVAPPVPPAGHLAPAEPPVEPPKAEKPSALSLPVHVGKPAPEAVDPPTQHPSIIARTHIAPDPPAVFPLGHTVAPQVAPPVAAKPEPAPLPAPQQPEPNHVTLRTGTLIPVRITDALSPDHNLQGDVWAGTLDHALIVDGFAIAERGARVRGEVLDARRGGLFHGNALLTIELKEVSTSDGQKVHIVTAPWHKEGGAANGEIKPGTSISFRVEQTVEITEQRQP
jgi:hypothetical protein